jgi:hypothetical protein
MNTVTELRTLPEKNQKLTIVKNKLLEEESNRITKRNILKQEFESDQLLYSPRIGMINGQTGRGRKMDFHFHIIVIIVE